MSERSERPNGISPRPAAVLVKGPRPATTLTHDEEAVLEKYRQAKAMPLARVYINLERGQIVQLDVTEKNTAETLAARRHLRESAAP